MDATISSGLLAHACSTVDAWHGGTTDETASADNCSTTKQTESVVKLESRNQVSSNFGQHQCQLVKHVC
jgi:hypothetical protein